MPETTSVYVQTDDNGQSLQYVKRNSDTEFEVMQFERMPTDWYKTYGKYGLTYVIVDLNDYTEKELDGIVGQFYTGGLEELRRIHGVDSNWIIAECVAETEASTDSVHSNDIAWVREQALKNGIELPEGWQ